MMIDDHYHVVERTGLSPERHTRIIIRLNRRRLSISPDSISEDPKHAGSAAIRGSQTNDIWHIKGMSGVHVTNNNVKPMNARECRRVGAGRAGRRKQSRALRSVSSNHCMMLSTTTDVHSADEVMEEDNEEELRERCNSLSSSKLLRRSKTEPQKQLMTDFFPVRRSNRTTSTQLKKQELDDMQEFILSGKEDGLQVVQIHGKGRGVVAKRVFYKGEYVVEYAGELVDRVAAKDREARYASDRKLGCYMYYFNYKDRGYCVDATAETTRLGRLINHSRLHPNCTTKIIELDGVPRLILVTLRTVMTDEELLYDYGDRNRETLNSHPWLAY